MESLFTIILNWNLPEITIDCVRSLLADGFRAEQILVVDNGSSDGSAPQIKAALDSRVRVIQSENNLGFAGGCNLGIRAALAEGTSWILLLNNDTTVEPGFYRQLEHATRTHPEVRVWGPLILYHDQPNTIWALGDSGIGGTLLTRHIARNRTIPPGLPPMVEVDYLTGCALLVHNEVFRTIGLLDPAFFMYVEDADFCLRAHRAGYRLACWTSARVLHKVSLSSGAESPNARLWRTGYQARFYRRSAGKMQRALLFVASSMRTLLLSVRDFLLGRRALAVASVRGWREGWFGAIDAPLGTPSQQLPSRVDESSRMPESVSWNE